MLKNRMEEKLDRCKTELLKAEGGGEYRKAARMARYAGEYSFRLGRKWEAAEFLQKAGDNFDRAIIESEERGEIEHAAAISQEASYVFKELSHMIEGRDRMVHFSREAAEYNMALSGIAADGWVSAERAMSAATFYIKAGCGEEALAAGRAAYKGYNEHIDMMEKTDRVMACKKGMHAVHCLMSIGADMASTAPLMDDAARLVKRVVDIGMEEMLQNMQDARPEAATAIGERIKKSMELYMEDELSAELEKIINRSYIGRMR